MFLLFCFNDLVENFYHTLGLFEGIKEIIACTNCSP